MFRQRLSERGQREVAGGERRDTDDVPPRRGSLRRDLLGREEQRADVDVEGHVPRSTERRKTFSAAVCIDILASSPTRMRGRRPLGLGELVGRRAHLGDQGVALPRSLARPASSRYTPEMVRIRGMVPPVHLCEGVEWIFAERFALWRLAAFPRRGGQVAVAGAPRQRISSVECGVDVVLVALGAQPLELAICWR